MKLESGLFFRTMSRVPPSWKVSSEYFVLLLALLATAACRAPGGKIGAVTPLNELVAPSSAVATSEARPPAPANSANPPLPSVSAPLPVVPQQQPTALPTGWVPLESLTLTGELGKPKLLDSATALTYVLQSTNNSCSFTIGSRQARVGDAECWLGFAPQLIKGRPHVHALDLQKNLLPLLSRGLCEFSEKAGVAARG